MKVRAYTKPFAVSNNRTAMISLVASVLAYFVTLGLALYVRDQWYLLVLAILLNGAASIRVFSLQHDCGHNSFFSNHKVNIWVGSGLSMFTLTPFKSWKFDHNVHHNNNGNLDNRGISEIYTMTVQEYEDASRWGRLQYRLYRNPFTLFFFGPLYIFFVYYRWPNNAIKTGLYDLIAHNALIIAFSAITFWLFGLSGMLVLFAGWAIGAIIGVFIFYVQQNFENTYWEHNPELDFETAALKGSSVLEFGPIFDLWTANIAYHDIHHLNARIPSYGIKKCHAALSEHLTPTKISFGESLRCLRWKLWDEKLGKMVTFP
jgi:omega-6 fatty acid desaturase (delta-12 desaturase)